MSDDPRELEKLATERAEADQRYDRAFIELDRVIGDREGESHTDPAELTGKQRLALLNQAWDILPGGSRTRPLWNLLWRVFAPALSRQRAFNSAVVSYLNRAEETNRHGRSALLQHLQTVAAFVDTRDRYISSALGSRAPVVEAALAGLTTDWLKRWESLAAREGRYDARTAALTKAYDDLREVVAIAQQSALTLKREMERLQSAAVAPAPAGASALTTGEVPPVTPAPPSDLNSFIYVGFQDRFRGSRDDIRARLLDYLPLFAGATDVLDIGCGRGELLDLFRQHGIGARGIDTNHEMVEVCRTRGLEAERADAVGFLQRRPDASLGGLIAIQVVEHLEPDYLMRLIEAASRTLRPGGVMVLETINPGCWVAFFESYIRDLTHVRPLHPDTLRYLVQASGFSQVDVQYRAPVPEADRLRHVQLPAPPAGAKHDPALVEVADIVNAHADTLNARLFTYMDYAVVARR